MPDPDNAVVLVADAEASLLRNVSSTLTKAGFTVLTAQGSPAVLDVCAHYREPIQLAIMDLAMTEQRPELVDCLYRSYPEIRILFTSPHDEPGMVRQLGRSGRVRDFLQKPFRRSQLLGRVLQVLDTPMVSTA
jgi:two-component system, cell cycle sensor histidine kinase and response regulator CckA